MALGLLLLNRTHPATLTSQLSTSGGAGWQITGRKGDGKCYPESFPSPAGFGMAKDVHRSEPNSEDRVFFKTRISASLVNVTHLVQKKDGN